MNGRDSMEHTPHSEEGQELYTSCARIWLSIYRDQGLPTLPGGLSPLLLH